MNRRTRPTTTNQPLPGGQQLPVQGALPIPAARRPTRQPLPNPWAGPATLTIGPLPATTGLATRIERRALEKKRLAYTATAAYKASVERARSLAQAFKESLLLPEKIRQLRDQLGQDLPEANLFGGPMTAPPPTPPPERALVPVPERAIEVYHTPLQALEIVPATPEPSPVPRDDTIGFYTIDRGTKHGQLVVPEIAMPSTVEPMRLPIPGQPNLPVELGPRAPAVPVLIPAGEEPEPLLGRRNITPSPHHHAIWRVEHGAKPEDFKNVIGEHRGMRFIYHVVDATELELGGPFDPADPDNAWHGVTTMDRRMVHTVRVRGSSRARVKNMYKAFKALSHGYKAWIGYVQLYSPAAAPSNFELFHGELNCVLAAVLRQVADNKAKARAVEKWIYANGWYGKRAGVDKDTVDLFAKQLKINIRIHGQAGIWHMASGGRNQKTVEIFASDNHASDYSPVKCIKKQVVFTEQRAIGPYKSEAKRPVVTAHAQLMEHYNSIHGVKRISAIVEGAPDLAGLFITSFRHEDKIYKTWCPPGDDAACPDYFSCTSELSYVTAKWKSQNRIRPLQEPYFSIFKAADHHLTTQQFQPYYMITDQQAPPSLHVGDGKCVVCGEFHDLDALVGVESTCPGAQQAHIERPIAVQLSYHSYDMNKAFPSFKTSPLYARYKIFYGFVNLYANTDLSHIWRPGASYVIAVKYYNPVVKRMEWIQANCWYTHIRLGFALMEKLVDIEISHTVVAAAEDLEYPFGPESSWGEHKQLNNAFIGNLIMGGADGVSKDYYTVTDPQEAQQIMYELRQREDTVEVVPMPGYIIHFHHTKPTQLYHIHAQIIDYQQTTLMANMCRVPLDNLVAFFTDGFYTREPIPLESSPDPGRFKYKGMEMIKGSSTFAAPVHHSFAPPADAPPITAHVNRLVGFNATTGPAGCGKTYISFVRHPRLSKVSLAPTHKKKADLLRYPALKVDTYHKFFKIGTGAYDTKQMIAEQVDIDEITMCTDEHMKKIIATCKQHRMNLSIYGDFALTGADDIHIYQRPPAHGKPISEQLLREFEITEEISEVRRQDAASAEWLDGLRDMDFPDILANCRAKFPIVADAQVPTGDNTVYGISSRHDRCSAFNNAFAAAARGQEGGGEIRVRRVARSTKEEHKGYICNMSPDDKRVWLDRQKSTEEPPKGTIYEAAQFVTSDYIQGDTIDGPIYIDLANCAAENFLYVALTRCKTLGQIRLIEDPATAERAGAEQYRAAYKKYQPWIRAPIRTEMPEPDNDVERDMWRYLGDIRAETYDVYANYDFPPEPVDNGAPIQPSMHFRLADVPAAAFAVREEAELGNRFLAFRSPAEYFLYRERKEQHMRTHHEVMRKKIRSVYVDIDQEISLDDTRFKDTTPAKYALAQQVKYVEAFLMHLQMHVNHGLQAERLLTYADLVVLDACGLVHKEGKSPAYKISFHIVCPHIMMDTVRMASFAAILEPAIHCDMSVYTANRSMRMEGCVKLGSSRVLRPSPVFPHLRALTRWQLFHLSLLAARPPTKDSHGDLRRATDHHYRSAGRAVVGKYLWPIAPSAPELYMSAGYYDGVLGVKAAAPVGVELTDARVKAVLEHPAVAPKVAGLMHSGTKKGCIIQLTKVDASYSCSVCQFDHITNRNFYLLARENGSVAFGCCFDASTRKAAGERARHVELVPPTVVEPVVAVDVAATPVVTAPTEPVFDADIDAALAGAGIAMHTTNTPETVNYYNTMGESYHEACDHATDDNEPPLTDIEDRWRWDAYYAHDNRGGSVTMHAPRPREMKADARYHMRRLWLREGKVLPIQRPPVS